MSESKMVHYKMVGGKDIYTVSEEKFAEMVRKSPRSFQKVKAPGAPTTKRPVPAEGAAPSATKTAHKAGKNGGK